MDRCRDRSQQDWLWYPLAQRHHESCYSRHDLSLGTPRTFLRLDRPNRVRLLAVVGKEIKLKTAPPNITAQSAEMLVAKSLLQREDVAS